MTDLEFAPTQEAPEIKKAEIAATKPVKKTKEKKEKPPKVEMERIGGLLPKAIVDKINNLALWRPDVTKSSLIQEGLEMVLEKYGDYPPKEGKLKRGRRPKKIEEDTSDDSDNEPSIDDVSAFVGNGGF